MQSVYFTTPAEKADRKRYITLQIYCNLQIRATIKQREIPSMSSAKKKIIYSILCKILFAASQQFVTSGINSKNLLSQQISKIMIINQQGLGQVGWGCRIYRLHLCRGVRFLTPTRDLWPSWLGLQNTSTASPQRVSWIWHETIWWRDYSNEAFRNAEYPFIAIAPRSTLTWSGSTWKVPMDQIELNCVLLQNWIVWNKTVFIFNCV